jgi:hypothetical protein
MAIGPMVEDSVVKKFSGSSVLVAGVDTYKATDSDIARVIDATHITFPIAKNGDSIGNFYSSDGYSIVVIDREGIVRFMKQLTATTAFDKKIISDASAMARNLLETGIVRPKAATVIAVRATNNLPRYFTLSGKTISPAKTSVRARIVMRSGNGRVTGVAQFNSPNP